MQLNVQRIEERIHKLQEIKRIASDPELLKMLMEFISLEDEPHHDHSRPAAACVGGSHQPPYNDIDDIAKVVNQVDEQPKGGALWARARG
jgi:hypothetical protein